MCKSDIITAIAQLDEGDRRLKVVAGILSGNQLSEKRPSLRLFKMGEAARETGLSRQTLWRAIEEGKLNTVEIRKGARRIHEDELIRFVGGAALNMAPG